VLGIVLPRHGRRIGRGESDKQMGQLRRGGLRIVEDDLAADGSAIGALWIIDAGHPIVRPLRGFGAGAGEGVLKHRVGIGR